MKKILYLALLLCGTAAFAQSPQKMSYQAVIRNSSDVLVANTTVGMRISILQGSASGTAVYVETQNPVTNSNGLAGMEVGMGTPVNGAFSAINWGNGPYFIKTETDPTGGSNYTISGTSEFSSVPYALYALNGTPGPAGAQGPAGPAPSGTGIVTVNNGVLQTPTGIINGGVAYGASGNVAMTPAGTAGRVLTSNGTGAPTWNAPMTFATFNGFASSSIAGSAANYVFVGPTTTITLPVPSRVTGSAVAGISTSTGASTTFQAGLCYQATAGGAITDFSGNGYLILQSGGVRSGTNASSSVVLPAGTYTVGFGVRNTGTSAMNNNDFVNGWVMITPL